MSPDEFQAHIFEGVFGTFESEGVVQHWVKDDSGAERRVDKTLTSLVGRTVQVAAHHLPTPPTPKDPSQWRNIVAAGVLGHDPESGVYTVAKFDGSEVELDLMVFCGCAARVLVATADAIERARDVVMQADAVDKVEGLGRQASHLKGLMDGLVKIVEEHKK